MPRFLPNNLVTYAQGRDETFVKANAKVVQNKDNGVLIEITSVIRQAYWGDQLREGQTLSVDEEYLRHGHSKAPIEAPTPSRSRDYVSPTRLLSMRG